MLGHRWLIIGGVVGSALVVATGGAILDVSSGQPARAVETTIVDLVLPDPVMVPERSYGHSRESAGQWERDHLPGGVVATTEGPARSTRRRE